MIMKNKGNDCFQTPKNIFNQLDNIFNFEMDLACDKDNCLCADQDIPDDYNALKMDWNKRCFCNPPFSRKADWIKKAHDEVLYKKCPIVVMILPTNCLDSCSWHEYIEGKFYYEILKGRVSFIDPRTHQPKSGNNSGTVIVYFKRKIKR